MSTELEERLAYLEKLCDDLSDIVAQQTQEIGRLQHRVGLLLDREAAREAENSGGVFVGDERPPHY